MSGRNALRWMGMIGAALTLTGMGFCFFGGINTAFAETSAPNIILANLTGKQDKIVINHRSVWCFGGSNYRLEYTPAPTPRLAVTDLWANGKGPKRLSTVTLTREQVLRLDNTLRLFRRLDSHSTAGNDTLEITAFRNGAKTAYEKFTSHSAPDTMLEDADPRDIESLLQESDWKAYLRTAAVPILSMRRVTEIAQAASKRHLAAVPYPEVPRNETGIYTTLRFIHRERADNKYAEEAARNFKGYALVRNQFLLHSVGAARRKPSSYASGQNKPQSYVQVASLSAVTPHLINEFQWRVLVENDKPEYDWIQFLQMQQTMETVVARHRWVRQWKEAEPGRTIKAQIHGMDALKQVYPEKYAYLAWERTGLRGAPRYEIELCRKGSTSITVYFGDQDDRALVLDASPLKNNKSRFWLDAVNISYSSNQAMPEYLTITPDGTWTQNGYSKE